MKIIGLCGGSGSGKGTVAQMLAYYGMSSIDADEVYRFLTKPGGSLIPALVKEFGSGIISEDGVLDRRQLSKIVFTSDGHEEKLKRLNSITHAAVIEETEKIMTAQKARGADFTSGSLIQRAKALIPVIIPLFVSAFNRASDLATAMECRCYHGGEGRTRMNVRHVRVTDIVYLVLFVIFGASLVAINMLGIGYTMG